MTLYGHLLRILHFRTSQTISRELTQMDLTSAQGHILGHVAFCQDAPCARDLEEHFHLSHATVSGLLTRLEKKEFIEQRPDAADRRCKRIYLLPKGKECVGRIRNAIDQNEAQIVAGFREEEKRIFYELLNRAVENMGGDPHHFASEEEPGK